MSTENRKGRICLKEKFFYIWKRKSEKKEGEGRTSSPSTQKLAYKYEETYAGKDTSAFCFSMLIRC